MDAPASSLRGGDRELAPVPTAGIPFVVIAAALAVQAIVQSRLRSHYDSRCASCSTTLSPSAPARGFALHRLGGSEYVRWPNCGRWSSVDPVAK